MQEQRRLWNHLLADPRAGPLELGLSAAGALEVIHLDAVILTANQVDGAGPFGGALRDHFVDDRLAVDDQACAVVGGGVEGVAAGGGPIILSAATAELMI